jgi:hypothetical protein
MTLELSNQNKIEREREYIPPLDISLQEMKA